MLYIKATKDLIQSFDHEIAQACKSAKAASTTLTLSGKNNSIRIVNFLNNVQIDNQVHQFLNNRVLYLRNISRASKTAIKVHAVPPGNIPATLGALINSEKSLKRAIKLVEFAFKVAKELNLLDIADYLKEMRFCLLVTKKTINNFSTAHRTTPLYPQDFCSLCWRLGNKHDPKNRNFSSRYCLFHHSELNVKNNKSAIRALIKASKIRNNNFDKDFLYEVDRRSKLPKMEKPYFSHINTFSFKARIELASGSSWPERADEILAIVSNKYPFTFQKIRNILPSSFKSWKGWFLACMHALDNGKKDNSSNWENSGDFNKASPDKQHDCNFVGYQPILYVFRRHEAFSAIMNTKSKITLKPGPEKGDLTRSKVNRKAIKKEIKLLQENQIKINKSRIAKKFDITRPTLDKIIKEMAVIQIKK